MIYWGRLQLDIIIIVELAMQGHGPMVYSVKFSVMLPLLPEALYDFHYQYCSAKSNSDPAIMYQFNI